MSRECEKSKSANMRKPLTLPQPGEIWELSPQIRYYGDFQPNNQHKLYSNEAQSFLQTKTPSRYVMIVTEPDAEIVSVMVLSGETNFISDVDLLIPADISGLTQDLLAETWHVQPMLINNLLQSVGKRLSRDIYDILLTIGDYFHGLVNQPPETNTIEKLGLNLGINQALKAPKISLFHEREEAWSDVLTIPVAAYHTYIKSVNFASQILNEQLQLEQELAEFEFSHNIFTDLLSTSWNHTYTILSRWTQSIFDAEWQAVSTLPNLVNTYGGAQPIATRSFTSPNVPSKPDEIAATIQELSSTTDELQRQYAAKRLGEIAVGNSEAIQALVNLLRSTSDDELLWIAVESLRKIDPENPAAGVKRMKLIDLGMEIAGEAVALAVGFLQKIDGDVSVLLQVYSTGNNDYLPPDLKLRLQDNSGNIWREVIARRADICIQLKFSGEIGEKFSVQIGLGNTNFSENFVI
ncbi:DUF1822 family protein [Anabaena sp. UHCC 0399]|uniref:DUF1822 family protein n=1 Tax=Anabaena sp. UHCC 0399 TaxID=3110238 RepID=UPI002B1EB877|nr:DUF1822 family protein [Anabaena sp. UHCC 0399]MEA5569176.1 DUF1822 family protein [Anabaena sp. UHCC 0399]